MYTCMCICVCICIDRERDVMNNSKHIIVLYNIAMYAITVLNKQ